MSNSHTTTVKAALEGIRRSCDDAFRVCVEYPRGEGREREFYSPFVLACGVILLRPLVDKEGLLEPLRPDGLRLIYQMVGRLSATPHKGGVYNFFGDRFSHRDLDTTALVNLALLLTTGETRLKDGPMAAAQGLADPSGAYRTWFDRVENRIDWGVNSNFSLLLESLGQSHNRLSGYLAQHEAAFLRDGSHYYPWTGLPILLREAVRCGDCHASDTHGGGQSRSPAQVALDVQERRMYFRGSRGIFGSRLLDNAVNLFIQYRRGGDSRCQTA